MSYTPGGKYRSPPARPSVPRTSPLPAPNSSLSRRWRCAGPSWRCPWNASIPKFGSWFSCNLLRPYPGPKYPCRICPFFWPGWRLRPGCRWSTWIVCSAVLRACPGFCWGTCSCCCSLCRAGTRCLPWGWCPPPRGHSGGPRKSPRHSHQEEVQWGARTCNKSREKSRRKENKETIFLQLNPVGQKNWHLKFKPGLWSRSQESVFQNCWSRNPKKSSDSTTLVWILNTSNE